MTTKFKDIYVGSFWNVVSHVALLGATLVCAKYYIHFLGLAQYGIYALLSAIISPFGLLNFSAAQSNVKYIAASLANGETKAAAAHLNAGVLISLISGAVGFTLLLAMAPQLATTVFNIAENQQSIFIASARWTAASWATTQLAASYSSAIVAQQRFKLFSVSTSSLSVAGLLIGLIALILGGDLVLLTKVRFVWSLVTLGYWVKWSSSSLGGAALTTIPGRNCLTCSWNFGKWQLISSLGGILSNQSDKYLLGAFIGAEAVGIYNIPTVIFGAVHAVVGKIGETLFPAFSKLTANASSQGEAHDLFLGSAWVIGMVMGLGQGIVLILAPELLSILLGKNVSLDAIQVLHICAIGAIFSAPSMVVTQYVLGAGETKWQALTTIASGTINTLCGVVFIARFGITGAAWGDLVALLLSRPAIHWLIWRALLRESMPVWEFWRALYFGPLLLCVAALTMLGLRTVFDIRQWYGGVCFALGYAAALLLVMRITLRYALPSAISGKLRADFMAASGLHRFARL